MFKKVPPYQTRMKASLGFLRERSYLPIRTARLFLWLPVQRLISKNLRGVQAVFISPAANEASRRLECISEADPWLLRGVGGKSLIRCQPNVAQK